MSQFFYGLHPLQTCHPLSIFGMLWIDVYDSVFQFPPISSNFGLAIEEEWDNIPQATINSLIQSMRRKCVVLYDANGGHIRYWLVFWFTPPFFLGTISMTNRPILVFPVVKSISLGPNELISFDWFPYTNCYSVKSFKLSHVAFIFWFSVHTMANTRSRNRDKQTQRNNVTMDQVVDKSSKVSLETPQKEICNDNEKLSKQMKKI